MTAILNTTAIALYLLAAAYQARFLFGLSEQRPNRRILLGLGSVALLAHAGGMIGHINGPAGLDLSFFSISSLIFCFITLISLTSTLRRPTDNLFVALFPMAAIAIVASMISSPGQPAPEHLSGGLLAHVLSSILAYSLLTIATIQAATVGLQDRQLKQHHTRGMLQALPPLQTMEAMLFELIWLGMLMLSISIISGAIFIDDIFAQHLVHKTALSISAWMIFAVLLWGRHQLGWRSQTAVRWTLGGFVALMLSYFGSKLVLELILHRV